MAKAYIKIYISEYDLQGDETPVPENVIKDPVKYQEFRQSCINDFVNKFKVHFKKKGIKTDKGKLIGYDFDSFGKGKYKDTKKNRMLKRVGKTYDRGYGIRDKIEYVVRNRNFKIEERVPTGQPIQIPKSRKWTEQDTEFLARNYNKLSTKALTQRLFRTPKSIYEKTYKLRKAGFITIVKNKNPLK